MDQETRRQRDERKRDREREGEREREDRVVGCHTTTEVFQRCWRQDVGAL